MIEVCQLLSFVCLGCVFGCSHPKSLCVLLHAAIVEDQRFRIATPGKVTSSVICLEWRDVEDLDVPCCKALCRKFVCLCSFVCQIPLLWRRKISCSVCGVVEERGGRAFRICQIN